VSLYEIVRGGAGVPVAMLHGFLGQPAAWMPVVERLTVPGPIALARLPGHGARPFVPEQAGFVEVVDLLADALPFDEPAWVAGYSMGGRLALAIALRRPERVRGALLVGASPGLRTETERAARARWDEEQAARVERLGVARFVDAWEALPLFASQAALPAEVLARQRRERCEHEPAAIAWAMRALGLGRMPPLWDALAGARVPIVALAGALDAKLAAVAGEMARTTARARRLVVPGAGHNVVLEAPSELARTLDAARGDPGG
jgi:2-succinyl-6-hydroxy-2,4-cyclohexadiene-1-carboxylate synthase